MLLSNREKKAGPNTPSSGLRSAYILRLIARCIIFMCCILLIPKYPDTLEILSGRNFFQKFSILHLLWATWVVDMIFQLIPVRRNIPLGSQKLFRLRFRPIRERINYTRLKEYILSTTRAAYRIFLLWAALITVIGLLFYKGILSRAGLFLIVVFFYVCDLICVLIWCPFRLILKNRCCTTCRIFNWDHLMMFSPFLFMGGFYASSLLLLSVLVWGVWELSILLFPERFWEHSNEALQCSQCTDKLCTQYCRKLR